MLFGSSGVSRGQQHASSSRATASGVHVSTRGSTVSSTARVLTRIADPAAQARAAASSIRGVGAGGRNPARSVAAIRARRPSPGGATSMRTPPAATLGFTSGSAGSTSSVSGSGASPPACRPLPPMRRRIRAAAPADGMASMPRGLSKETSMPSAALLVSDAARRSIRAAAASAVRRCSSVSRARSRSRRRQASTAWCRRRNPNVSSAMSVDSRCVLAGGGLASGRNGAAAGSVGSGAAARDGDRVGAGLVAGAPGRSQVEVVSGEPPVGGVRLRVFAAPALAGGRSRHGGTVRRGGDEAGGAHQGPGGSRRSVQSSGNA